MTATDRRPRPAPLGAVLALALLLAPGAVAAQSPDDGCWLARGSLADAAGRESPLDSARVVLGGERALVCYGSPRARGRTVMGGLVPWDSPWRLGANEATALYLPFPAELGGAELEPGVYSLYAVPGAERWTVVVNGAPHRWGIPIDAGVRGEDVARFDVEAGTTDEPVEALTLRFEPAGADAADLVVEWERTRLRIPLRRTDP